VSGVKWGAVGTQIGAALGNAIKFSAAAAGKIVDSFTNAILAHSNQIADVGAKITAELVANLLDPAFWIKNWKTGLAIGLAFVPVGDVLGIGAKIGKLVGEGLTSVFLRVAARLPEVLQRGIGAAVRIGSRLFQRLGDRAFSEIQHALSRTPGLVQKFVGTGIKIGQTLFDRLGGFIISRLGAAMDKIGTKIQSTLIGRTLAWLAKFALIRSAISAIASAFQFVIDKIKEAIGWAGNLASKIASIPTPGSVVSGLKGLLPHTGGIVTRRGMQGYATGGLAIGGVAGRDSIPALLTPGEIVLNEDQQRALLHGGMSAPVVQVFIDGKEIESAVYRVQRRTGRSLQAGRVYA
jgi:hypothetical protein